MVHLDAFILIACIGGALCAPTNQENDGRRGIDFTTELRPTPTSKNLISTDTTARNHEEKDVGIGESGDKDKTPRPFYVGPVLPFLMFSLVIAAMVVTGKLYVNLYKYHKNTHAYAIPLPHCPPKGCPDYDKVPLKCKKPSKVSMFVCAPS